ncbi:MAG: dipeptide ABC transporter ATP-binding protein [Burkholderiales bacterium]|nr:dipeptide ABC transporter ATP-binding protein [Burkholderiales bacterium]MDE2454255.1 dipeptide ABC transporter ATP-binding protein [Burkholderiales bacterium]
MTEPLLVVDDLHKHYPVRGGVLGRRIASLRAVDGVSFTVGRGRTLGLVGESGCGKSTLGRTLMRLEEPTQGRVRFEGRDLADAKPAELFALRRDIQMVFQDPYSSLNPRLTVGEIVREPLLVHRVGSKAEQIERVRELFATVGLGADALGRYPSEFSGGQRQRIGVARALALGPKLVVADEPVSALDVSVQSQVLNLMLRLQRELGLAYVFISHDLSVVEHVSDDVAVMYLGRIVEQGPAEALFATPAHPYTRALIQAIPNTDPRRRGERAPLEGEAPSPLTPPPGCPFSSRCPHVTEACRRQVPLLEALNPAEPDPDRVHRVACIRSAEIAGAWEPSR